MAKALGRLASLSTAIVVGGSMFYPPVHIHSPAMQRQTSVSEQSVVEAAYKAYLRAWKDKDYATLDQLLSDDYKAVNFRGIVSTKANEIATAKEDHDYADMKGDVMSVTLFGGSAVASGLIDASWKDGEGKTQQITVRFLAVLSKQNGKWKLVATQSTRFNKPGNG